MDESPVLSPRDIGPDNPLHDLPIEITISVGRTRPTLQELLALGENAVLLLDRRLDDPVELFIGERLIARGVLQEAGEDEPGQLAVRLTEVVTQRGLPD